MQTTENLGLRKPEENDFFNVEDFNNNSDALDALFEKDANGLVAVQNAKTLDGHEAEYFAPLERVAKVDGTERLFYSILEHALTLERGVYEYALQGGNYKGTDLPHGNYAYGNATIFKRDASYILVVLWGLNGIYDTVATNCYRDSAWNGWRQFATTSDLVKYLPLTGGYLSGNLYLKSDKAEQLVAYLQNSLRRGGLILTADGSLNFYDYTNGKKIIESTVTGTNAFNGTASGNLPLTGGTLTGFLTISVKDNILFRLKSTGSNGAFIAFSDANGTKYLGCDTNGIPKYSDGAIERELLHSGNITDYVAADSEVGTFTLKLNGVTLGTGTYYKVGKMVHCRATGNLPQVVDKGYVSLTGLPFANASLNGSTVDFHVHQYYGTASDNLVFNVGASEITLNVTATIGQNQPFNFSTIYFTA